MSDYKRLTLDLVPDDHTHLKQLCALLGVSMREFGIQALRHEMEKIEEEMDIRAVREARKALREGREEVVDLDEMEKRLGWDKL